MAASRSTIIVIFSLGVILASLAAVLFGASGVGVPAIVVLAIALILLFLGGYQLGRDG